MKRTSFLACLLIPLLTLAACDQPPNTTQAPDNRTQQQRAATEAARAVTFTDNAEINNIQRRTMMTANPNLLGYIILMNEAGQPIIYEGVRGKVTTSGSRLTPPDQVVRSTRGDNGLSQVVIRAPSDTGTYDTGSTQFIFYWNTDGAYRQWSGPYLYSDQPIRLRVEPLVVNVVAAPGAR